MFMLAGQTMVDNNNVQVALFPLERVYDFTTVVAVQFLIKVGQLIMQLILFLIIQMEIQEYLERRVMLPLTLN